jgi:adenylate cyclase class 2
MAVEIEVKARLDSPDPVKQRLEMGGPCRYSYEKNDVYWFPAEQAALPSGIRIRRERKTAPGLPAEERVLVTFKTKEIRDGVEINDEQEFTLAGAEGDSRQGAEVFAGLLGRLGLTPGVSKEKRGWAWELAGAGQPPVLAELSLVTGLGWFIELEIIAENRDEQTIKESRRRLFSLLAELGISEARIEKRPYTLLLELNFKSRHTAKRRI